MYYNLGHLGFEVSCGTLDVGEMIINQLTEILKHREQCGIQHCLRMAGEIILLV